MSSGIWGSRGTAKEKGGGSRRPAAPPPGPARAEGRPALAAAVFALAALPFLPALGAGFVDWDDPVNLLANPRYRGFAPENLRWMFTSVHGGHYSPVAWLTFALDHALWGMDPRGYHLTSVLVHAAGAVLVFFVARALLRAATPRAAGRAGDCAAAFAALFFAVHPLRVESVAWVTERRDVLSGALLFGAVLAWLRAVAPARPRGRWVALALLLYALSLLSKATALALPFVLLALDLYPLRRLGAGSPGRSLGRLALEKVPFAAIAAGAAVAAAVAQRSAGALLGLAEHGPLERAAQAAFALAFYLVKTALPLRLSPLYELDPELDPAAGVFLSSAALVVAITALALWRARRRPALAVAWASYVLLAAPVLGLVQSGVQIAADRFTYLPSVPLAVLAAGALLALGALRRRRVASTAAAALVLAALGAASWIQTGHWRDSRSLWERVVEADPESHLGHVKLGILLHKRGEHGAAIEHYTRAIELRPGRGGEAARYNLALTWLALGEPGRAEAELWRALELAPADFASLRQLAAVLEGSARAGEAEDLWARALEARPGWPEAWIALAGLRARRGDAEGALVAARRAADADPGSARARRELGRALLAAGRPEEAERELRRAVQIEPGRAGLWVDLGSALERLGRLDAARSAWRRALQIDPAREDARRRLEGAGLR